VGQIGKLSQALEEKRKECNLVGPALENPMAQILRRFEPLEIPDPSLSPWLAPPSGPSLQGYLAPKKHLPPRTLQWDYT